MNFSIHIWPWALAFLLWTNPALLHGQEDIERLRIEAIRQLRTKATQGDAEAQHELAVITFCTESENYIQKNEGLDWLKKAAQQGHAESQHFLASLYVFGDLFGDGVEHNMKESLKWNQKAADQGFADAQQLMGRFYANGDNVVKNNITAYMWYLLAKSNGNLAAVKDVDNIEKLLSLEQRAEGQRLATEWQAAFEKKQNVK